MKLYNITDKNEVVTFKQASLKGLGSYGGLFLSNPFSTLRKYERTLKTRFYFPLDSNCFRF